MPSPLKTAQQVKDLLTDKLANDPGNYAATLNYVIVDMFQKITQIAVRGQQTVNEVKPIKEGLQQLLAMVQAAAPAAADAGGESPPAAVGGQPAATAAAAIPIPARPPGPPRQAPPAGPPSGSSKARYNAAGQRLGANNEPLDPEQQAIEEEFDRAAGEA